jgi:hypothetical protein
MEILHHFSSETEAHVFVDIVFFSLRLFFTQTPLKHTPQKG